MCWSSESYGSTEKVYKRFNSDGTVSEYPEEKQLAPEHVDNPMLNTDFKTGILGFRYETKDCTFVVYSSIECKTFAYIMQLRPLKD